MKRTASLLAVLLVAACSGGGAAGGSSPVAATNPSGSTPGTTGGATQGCMPANTPAPTPTPGGPSPVTATGLTVPNGFTIQIIGTVSGARELAALPNGDLLVATEGTDMYIIPNATGTNNAGNPRVFTSIDDSPDAGITFSLQQCAVYVGTQYGVYKIPYTIGNQTAASSPQKIASVRTGAIAPNSDGDVHHTTSLAITGSSSSQTLYASIGSSCNACTEVDPTRGSIQQMSPGGSGMTTRATRIRNAIAATIDPATGHLWAGDAGQDDLPTNHPYEFLDDVSSHSGVADYGWPDCEENHIAYVSGSQCANTVEPLVEFPAYSTLIGNAFYPSQPTGTYAFPSQYRGGIFVTRHGSWHTPNGCAVNPEVDFVPMNGDTPKTPVNWNDPTTQWQPFVSGFQPGCAASTRIGRPTGIAVAADGSLFVADDQTGNIYRIRY